MKQSNEFLIQAVILGKEVVAFEKNLPNFMARLTCRVANELMPLPCASNVLANLCDEVITPSQRQLLRLQASSRQGTPVFADIDPITKCIDPKSIEDRVSANTRAIMPVHIYGQPSKMYSTSEIAKAHDLAVERIARRHMERKSMDKKWAPLQIFLLSVVTRLKTLAALEMAVLFFVDLKSLPKDKISTAVRLEQRERKYF